jgi:hypothetical protein
MNADDRRSPGIKAKPNRAVRLTFAYDGDNVRLVARQPMTKTPPRSDATEGYEGQSGSWLEIRDAQGRVLHRHILHHPIKHDVEVLSDAPGHPFVRRMLAKPQGSFEVIVPEFDGPHSVRLFHSTHRRGVPSGPSEQVAQFDLTPQDT